MSRSLTDDASGLLLVDKSVGPTSHDIVRVARRAFQERRIGHTGTLDPFANGLLLLAVGSMTRLVEYFHALAKVYVADLVLGVETDTHDVRGEATRHSREWRGVSAEDIEGALAGLTGEIQQIPPAFSAKKVDGVRSYRAARAGRPVALKPVQVEVFELALEAFEPPLARLRVRVSTGTYVRALARDVGEILGCGAHLTSLRRTSIGPFQVGDAIPGADLGPGVALREPHWLTPAGAVGWLEARELHASEVELIRSGRPIATGRVSSGTVQPHELPDSGGLPVALLSDGKLVAVAEREGGALQPRKVLSNV